MNTLDKIFPGDRSDNSFWDGILRKLMLASGAFLILFSLISLLGWIDGLGFLLVINKDYIPIAPVTAIFFTLIGISFILLTKPLNTSFANIVIRIILGLILIYGLLKCIGYVLNFDLVLEYYIFPVTERIGIFPIKHMSPFTGLLFVLTSFSLLLLFRSGSGLLSRNISASLGTVIALSGFITELGYLYHTPFLYSGNTIPLSSRAGLSFLVTGLGLVFSSGGDTIILRHLAGSTPYSRILRIFIPSMIILFMVQGIADVILSHTLHLNEAIVLACITALSIVLGIPLVIKITSSIFLDATNAEKERIKVMEELRRTLSVQRLLLENNPLGICMVTDNNIQWSNNGFCRIFSRPDQECKGLNFSSIFPDEHKETLNNIWIPQLKSGKIVDAPLGFGDNKPVWIRFIGSALENDQGSLTVIWIAEDITERKNQRETMRLLSHSLSSLSECVSITDTADKIIYVNKAFEETYGYESGELIGKDIRVVGSDRNPELKRIEILPSTYSGSGWSGELINRRKDGSEFPIYLNTSKVFNEKNEIIALIGVAVDITDRKAAEKREKEFLDQVKAANDAKDRLFGIISHDLRSPFSTILGFVQILTEQYDELTDAERKSFLNELKKASENTFSLIENLLTWSRSQRGGITVSPERLNMGSLVGEQANLLSESAKIKNLDLASSLNDDLVAYADKEMIRTVIRNLLTNSVKFTEPGGKITISARTLDKEIELSISDTGMGIPPERIEFLFSLQKASSTPGTRNEKGTGLGLLICKEFVEKNGGKISVHSKPGEGTTFSFLLPVPSE